MDFEKLNKAGQGSPFIESEVEDFEGVDLSKYSRPKNEEVTIGQIVNFVENRGKTQHIYTDDLRENKEVIQDSFESYLGASDYLSSSFLKKALLTPRHLFYERYANPKLREYKAKKSSFELGTFIHEAILEPTKFSRVFVEPSLPGVNKNTVEHWRNVAFAWGEKLASVGIDHTQPKNEAKRDEYKSYVEGCKVLSGIESISEEDNLKIQAFKQVYDQYGGGIIHDLLKHSKREISMYSEDEETGLKVRIRPDAIQFEENIGVNAIISVKSTRSADLSKFYYDCAKYHYDLSEAMYQEVATKVTGRKFDTTIMIMVQTVEPFGVAVLKWSETDLATGKYKYKTALSRVKEFDEHQLNSSYDCYAEEGNRGIIESVLPWWNQKEIPAYNFIG